MVDSIQSVIVASRWTAEHALVPGGHQYLGKGNEYCFFLELGKELFINAKSWAHHTTDPNDIDIMYGLQTLIMAIDDTELGSIQINCDNPAAYKYCVQCCAKKIKRCIEKHEEEFMKYNTSCTKWFNIDQQKDITRQIEKLESDEENEGDDVVESAPKRVRRNRIDVLGDPRFQSQYFCGLIGPGYNSCDMRLEGMPEFQFYEEDDDEPDVRDMEIDEDVEEDLAQINTDIDVLLQGEDRTLPKARFTITPVTHKDGNHLTGYFVRIIQVDPSWNPGKTIRKMMEHRAKRMSINRGRFYKDPYIKYYPFRKTLFPVYNVSQSQWVRMCNKLNGVESTSEMIARQYGNENVENYAHSIHPCNVFTLDLALNSIRNAGGDPAIWDKGNFVNPDHQGFKWPAELSHYSLLPEQVFWYDPYLLGLSEMTFPNIKLDNEALSMMNQFGACNEDQHVELGPLDRISAATPVLRREDVMKALPPVVGIPTKNIILLTAAEADMVEKRISRLKPDHFEDTVIQVLQGKMSNQHPRAKECALYSEVLDKSHSHFMRQFENIFQLETDVTYISIPEAIKVLIRYLQDNFGDRPLTRYMRLYDENMDFFGNAQMRYTLLIERARKLIQPLIALKIEGVFGVYARRKGQLLYHYINYGGRDKGKSYTVIEGGKFQMVDGSYTEEQIATDAAYLTDTDYEHIILFRDEVEEYVVNEKLANGKDVKKANIKKAVMTGGEIHMRVFMFEEVPGKSEKVRTSRLVRARMNIAEICTTNHPVNKGVTSGALVSRYHAESMKRNTAPVEQHGHKVDDKDKREAREFFCINQAMSCIVEQAMTMNAIVREPTMDLWHDLAGRVLDALRNYGVISREEGVRGLEKMAVFARQLVVKMAIHYTYDFPGAPFYGQMYNPRHLQTLQRYLYFHSSYAVYLYPLLVSEFIDEDCAIVLRAMCKLIHVDPEKDMYEQYVSDVNARRHIGKRYNSKYQKDNAAMGPQEWIELNYFEIEGDLVQVSQQIAEKTQPRMDSNMVKSVLLMLMKHQFNPTRVYKPQNPHLLDKHIRHHQRKAKLSSDNVEAIIRLKAREMGVDGIRLNEIKEQYAEKSLRDTHSIESLQRILLSISYTDASLLEIRDPYEKAERLDLTPFQVEMVLRMFKEGCVWEAGTPETYTLVERLPDNSLPSIDELDLLYDDQNISVVKYHNPNRTHRKVMFAAEAIRLFNPDIIIEALEDAMICGSTRPGKRIVGFADAKDMTKLRTVNWTKQFIEKSVEQYDALKSEAVSRKEGIVFNRRGYMTKKIASIMSERDRIISKTSANPIELCKDMDRESALKHHLKCPNPMEEPVRDDDFIKKAYYKALKEGRVKPRGHATCNYPGDLIKEMQAAEEYWNRGQGIAMSRKARKELAKLKKI